MTDIFAATEAFMRASGQVVATRPGLPHWGDRGLRLDLLTEEYREYLSAEYDDDLVEIVDGLIDTIVIAYGSLLAYVGPEVARAAMGEVARSNLAKIVDGKVIRREDGKILKPAGWVGPDIKGIIERAQA